MALMISVALATLILSASPEARRIEDPRGFSFQLPSDFIELPGFQAPAPTVRTGTLGTWVRSVDSDDFVIVSLEGLGGTIGRDPMDVAALGQLRASALTEHWKGFPVDGFRLVEKREGQTILILSVQVPLAPHALQVMTSGLAGNEEAIHDTLVSVLGSLEGPTNWLTDEERVAKGVEGAVRLTLTFLVVAALGLGAWRLLRKRR